MNSILSAVFLCTILATPAAAQDYYGSPGAYDGYNGYDRLVPPLPVPGYPVSTTHSVVTTRRILGSPPGYVGYGDPDTVVTNSPCRCPSSHPGGRRPRRGLDGAFALSADQGHDLGSTGLAARDRRASSCTGRSRYH